LTAEGKNIVMPIMISHSHTRLSTWVLCNSAGSLYSVFGLIVYQNIMHFFVCVVRLTSQMEKITHSIQLTN